MGESQLERSRKYGKNPVRLKLLTKLLGRAIPYSCIIFKVWLDKTFAIVYFN